MKNPIATLALTGLLSATATVAQEPFTVDTLFKIDRLTNVAISPGGDEVAAVSQRWTGKTYWDTTSALWLISTRDGRIRRAVDDPGELSQSKPTWSPDGKLLAYSAKREKETRLRVIRLKGGEAPITLTVCGEKETIGAMAWKPDSTALAVICSVSLLDIMQKEPEKKTIIVATESDIYRGKAGPRSARRVVLFDIASGKTREVARNETFLANDGALIWRSPQTLWIVGTPDVDWAGVEWAEGRRIHKLDVASGTLTTLPIEFEGSRMPMLSADGREFIMPVGGSVGTNDWRMTWRLIPLKVKRFDTQGKLLSDTHPLEVYVGRSATQIWAPAPGSPDGGLYYVHWLDRASGRIKALNPATGEWTDITPANVDVEDFSISAGGARMAVVQGNANTPNEVYLFDLKQPSAKPKRLTRFEDAVRKLYAVSPVERLKWRSKDDRFDIDGWLLEPVNYVKGKRYPMIVDVHGGPGVAFRNSFEAFHYDGAHQVAPELYAARGYMVLMVNPRGDPGYGREHLEALLEGWPPATRNDIFAGVDEMVRLGYADEDRLGIAGASYGGWVTAFAVTQTDRFKAASANDPVIDSNISSAVAYRGDAASNYWLHAGFTGAHLFEKPFETADPTQVNTPILLRFGLREQPPFPSMFFISGLPYFTYLDTHCKPVEMIMHPEEGHGISSWETLRDYIQRDLAWFDYWIKGEGEPPLKKRTCPKQ